ALCGAEGVYLDEVILDDKGGRIFCCSDTDFCEKRRADGHRGSIIWKDGMEEAFA
ncbi:MAG: alpha-D-ribose 1-methylphosphonate 5-phosphate C-P-lyase PhnJ, partial [Pseudomonadota bacterium]